MKTGQIEMILNQLTAKDGGETVWMLSLDIVAEQEDLMSLKERLKFALDEWAVASGVTIVSAGEKGTAKPQ